MCVGGGGGGVRGGLSGGVKPWVGTVYNVYMFLHFVILRTIC